MFTGLQATSNTQLTAVSNAALESFSSGNMLDIISTNASAIRIAQAREGRFQSMMVGDYLTPTKIRGLVNENSDQKYTVPQVNNILIFMEMQNREKGTCNYTITESAADLGAGHNIIIGKTKSVRWHPDVVGLILERLAEGDLNVI